MAHDHQPTGANGAASDGRNSGAVLRDVLRALLDASDEQARVAEAVVRPAVRQACEDARRHRRRVEEVILDVKQEWFALGDVHRLPRGGAGHPVLERVVTLCIEEFYSAGR